MNFLSRRGFLTGSACLLAAGSAHAQLSLPQNNALNFRVLRDGSDIGVSRVIFDQAQNILNVRSEVDIVVKLGPIVLYRYEQRIEEKWSGDQFQSADSRTNDNGNKLFVSVGRDDGGIVIDSTTSGHQTSSGNATLATYWKRAFMDGPTIGSEDGHIFYPTVSAQAWESVPISSGAPINARHYVLTGDLEMDLWYDHDDQWRSMRLKARDNSLIQYILA